MTRAPEDSYSLNTLDVDDPVIPNSPVATQFGIKEFASPPIANRDPDPVNSGFVMNCVSAEPDRVNPPVVEYVV